MNIQNFDSALTRSAEEADRARRTALMTVLMA
jgi:hypothetical protein